MAKDTDKIIREFLAQIGSKGGKTRARKYDKATLSKWAKKGGRPPKKERASERLQTGRCVVVQVPIRGAGDP